MIYIEKNSVNSVILTLSDSITIDNPYFAFQFVNGSTGEINIFLATDTSAAPDRYNLFSIVEQTTGLDPLNAIIELSPVGQWIGKIYESATESIAPDDWGILLQTEVVVVAGDESSVNEIYR